MPLRVEPSNCCIPFCNSNGNVFFHLHLDWSKKEGPINCTDLALATGKDLKLAFVDFGPSCTQPKNRKRQLWFHVLCSYALKSLQTCPEHILDNQLTQRLLRSFMNGKLYLHTLYDRTLTDFNRGKSVNSFLVCIYTCMNETLSTQCWYPQKKIIGVFILRLGIMKSISLNESALYMFTSYCAIVIRRSCWHNAHYTIYTHALHCFYTEHTHT